MFYVYFRSRSLFFSIWKYLRTFFLLVVILSISPFAFNWSNGELVKCALLPSVARKKTPVESTNTSNGQKHKAFRLHIGLNQLFVCTMCIAIKSAMCVKLPFSFPHIHSVLISKLFRVSTPEQTPWKRVSCWILSICVATVLELRYWVFSVLHRQKHTNEQVKKKHTK